MNIDNLSVWLVGTVLFSIGSIALAAGAIVINNLLHKFWKPTTIFTRESFSIFSGHPMNSDPLNTLSQEEYDKLVKHLEEIRKSKEN
jgi:hypothetical protein